jgi:hypothetical protein
VTLKYTNNLDVSAVIHTFCIQKRWEKHTISTHRIFYAIHRFPTKITVPSGGDWEKHAEKQYIKQ